MHSTTRLIMDCRTLSKVGCDWFSRQQNFVGEESLYLQVELLYYFHGAKPPVGQDLLTVEASLSRSDTTHLVGILWTSDQPEAETST